MRKPLSTQRLEKIIKLLPLLTGSDILLLQKAVTENINLRRTIYERAMFFKKGKPNVSLLSPTTPIEAVAPTQPISSHDTSPTL